jgi:Rrf2 family protein
MISITTKSPYAVRALVELHRYGGNGPVPIAELARRGDIPVQFLEQLFATLRRAGLLRSQRGVKGGYSFARPAEEIPVLEISAARAVLAQSTVADVLEAEARAAGSAMYHI